jgi:hypothetical protein
MNIRITLSVVFSGSFRVSFIFRFDFYNYFWATREEDEGKD